MADRCSESWPAGSFLANPAIGGGRRLSMDPFGAVWWPADALGCPNDLVATLVAAAVVQAPFTALDPEALPIAYAPVVGWTAYGQQRVSAWNGGGSD